MTRLIQTRFQKDERIGVKFLHDNHQKVENFVSTQVGVQRKYLAAKEAAKEKRKNTPNHLQGGKSTFLFRGTTD